MFLEGVDDYSKRSNKRIYQNLLPNCHEKHFLFTFFLASLSFIFSMWFYLRFTLSYTIASVQQRKQQVDWKCEQYRLTLDANSPLCNCYSTQSIHVFRL